LHDLFCPQPGISGYLSNDSHRSVLAIRTHGHINAGEQLHHFPKGVLCRLMHAPYTAYKGSKRGQVLGFVPVCQKAKMTDSDESMGQGVEQKATNEFHRCNGMLPYSVDVSISVGKGNHAVFYSDDTLIRERDPMGVAAQVFKYVFRSVDRLSHADHPFVGVETAHELGELLRFPIGGKDTGKVQGAAPICRCHILDECSAKHEAQSLFIEQVVFLARLPLLPTLDHGPSGNQAMEVEVGIELLVPGMQDGDESHVSAQSISGVTTKAQESFGYGVKQDREHSFLIAQNNGITLVGKREYGVKVADGHKLCLAGFKPSFARDVLTCGTVTVSAGVIGDPLSATVIALLDAASKIRRSAGDEVGYDLVLMGVQGVCFLILRDMLPENVGDLTGPFSRRTTIPITAVSHGHPLLPHWCHRLDRRSRAGL